MTSWREFWDSAHSIYVSERHKDVHYRDVAERLAAFVPHPHARVLDHGSGEAIHADLVAAGARELLLCDSAASVRASIAARFAGKAKIKVIAPEDVERLPDASLDLIFANALSRYRRLRSELGIARYSEAEFLAKLRAAGFSAERLPRNVEHNPARMTFRARVA